MASADMRPTSLPNAKNLSKHSQKFYNGTYKWDSDGFVDDKGVYRRFDCYDRRSRAPTPLPPSSLGDDEEDSVFSQQTTDVMAIACESSIDTKTLTFAPDPKRSNSIGTVRCSELLRGHANREYLIGKLEGALIASKASKVDLTLEECYHLCSIPYPNEQTQLALQENSTPTTSASVKPVTGPAAEGNNLSLATSPKKSGSNLRSPSSSSSSLSDCPSDISQWDIGISIPVHASTREIKDLQAPPQEAEQQQPEPKHSTRGFARKVKRGAKKSKA